MHRPSPSRTGSGGDADFLAELRAHWSAILGDVESPPTLLNSFQPQSHREHREMARVNRQCTVFAVDCFIYPLRKVCKTPSTTTDEIACESSCGSDEAKGATQRLASRESGAF